MREQEACGEKCVLTRKPGEPGETARGGPGSGRPVGFLAAWLARGCDCGSRERHWADDNLLIPCAERMLARMYVLDLPGGVELSDKERPPHDAYDQDGELMLNNSIFLHPRITGL